MEIKLIAFDLDGTLLREDKTVSPANQTALRAAAAQGIFLVPATGRIYPIIPEQVKQMPEIRYFICVLVCAGITAVMTWLLHRNPAQVVEGPTVR